MHSLRTTLALTALSLVNDLAVHLSTALDSYLDLILRNLIKVSNSSKKLLSQGATTTTTTILQNTSYHSKTLTTLISYSSDKNNQLRSLVAGYIKIILEVHGKSRREVIEKTGGVEIMGKWLKRGVSDATPLTREICRDCFVLFWELWTEKARKILNEIDDANSKKQTIRQLGSLYSMPTNGKATKETGRTVQNTTNEKEKRSKNTNAVVSPTSKAIERKTRQEAKMRSISVGSSSSRNLSASRSPPPPKPMTISKAATTSRIKPPSVTFLYF